MESGCIIFQEPCILHEGLDRYNLEEDRFRTLRDNGFYLALDVFGTDIPSFLMGKKMFFREKFINYEEENAAYLVVLKGTDTLVEEVDDKPKEISVIPEELFEI